MNGIPAFPGNVAIGQQGDLAQFVQEMLRHSGFHLTVDKDYGEQTAATVKAFQSSRGISATGTVDSITFDLLKAPLVAAFASVDANGRSLAELVVAYAMQHLKQHPQEIPRVGQLENAGPWVREYMDGHEGHDWPWCAGFATYIVRQASRTLQLGVVPIERTYSCEHISTQAKTKGFRSVKNDLSNVHPGSLFLLHNADKNPPWAHVGIVTSVQGQIYTTIEGNASDDSVPTHEVCVLRRSVPDPSYETYFVNF